MKPLLSIVVSHFQHCTDGAIYDRLLSSLWNQRLGDAEVLLYHDGFLDYPPRLPGDWTIREVPYEGCWGHNQRNQGIHDAKGEWIWCLNADSVALPGAVERICIAACTCNQVGLISFPMWNCKYDWPKRTIIPGDVIKKDQIDCTQVVVSKRAWEDEGGWTHRTYDSDALHFESIAARSGFIWAGGEPIVEHW